MLLLLLSSSVRAGAVTIFFEEDAAPPASLLGLNEDRNYTGGGALEINGDWIGTTPVVNWPLVATGLLLENRKWNLRDGHDQRGSSLMIPLTAFTPDDLRSTVPVETDRPYSALVGMGWRSASASSTRGIAYSNEVMIGVLGLDGLGYFVQETVVHANARDCEVYDPESTDCQPYRPEGWEFQISHGGEPTARVSYGRHQRLMAQEIDALSSDQDKVWWTDLSTDAGLDLGYYTMLNGGVMGRLGRIHTPSWAFHSSPLRGANQAASTARSRLRWEAFVFAATRANLVGYNALLQGQFRESEHTFSASEIRRLVMQYDLGLSLGVGPVRLTSVLLQGRGPEFRSDTPRHHWWSAYHLTIQWGDEP
ncbi:MAG: hypothetical protein ACI8RZ_005010 [Myxococcota bacterium]|jgi:hypothetical protein